MRIRLVAALTAAILAAPFLSATAQASPSHQKCESARTEHKCKGGKG
jgi:hypothetical protein